MKKTIIKKLGLWLTIAGIISAIVFVVMTMHSQRVSSYTTAELGSIYMSEMMFQVQDHFETIVEIKNKEAEHIAMYTNPDLDINYKHTLCSAAQSMDFDYLALYDQNGNYNTLLGEAAWYRNLDGFISRVKNGDITATTGYLTTTGDKYLVFAVPAEFEMQSGGTSTVMLAGFSVKKLYDYIDLDELNPLGRNATVEIILSNGSYVLQNSHDEETNFYNHIKNIGSFTGMGIEEGVTLIEKAMASGDSFSCMVSLSDTVQHIYIAPASEPSDWYFMLSMPQGVTDSAISHQNTIVSRAFFFGGLIIISVLIGVFILYLRTSLHQINATEAALEDAKKARAEAETANQAKSTFLSNMSHDIRTPMNAIVGFTEIMEENILSGNDEKALEYLQKMKRSSDYLRHLINDVLDMSKIESGRLALTIEPVQLSKTIDTIITIANTQTVSNNQMFDVNVHDIICDDILCDQTHLKQILINLLSNAIKFTPRGGTITLEVWQEECPDSADHIRNCFIVKDTGIGMSPEFIKTMFDSFSREESKVRKIEGTGLGLTITKTLLDMMNGSITTESKEGHGSKFTIILDFLKVETPTNNTATTLSLSDMTGVKVLLAEDNDFNYDIAEVLLGENGFEIERAENGQIAVEKYCSNPSEWDIILMDLRMPILNGYQATEKIREFEKSQPNNLHIPIIALSADVFSEDIEHCRQVGMEGHIAKPIDMNELLQVLQTNIKHT